MRVLDIISEASSLDLGKVTKTPERTQKFFDLINQGHTFQSTDGPVQLDKKTITDLQPILVRTNVGSGVRPMVTKADGTQMLMSKLHYDDAAFGGRGKSYVTPVSLKPHPTFQHQNPQDKEAVVTPELAIQLGAFKAADLNNKIQGNPILDQQGEAGRSVKLIAQQISQGEIPTIPQLDTTTLGVILNDAFEYLGPMQLIYGTADFPNSDAFYQHIGSNLQDLVLYFPGAVNHPVADSIAMTNRMTDNTIYLSSKGGKTGKGAPSSISAMKMPEHMKKSIGRDQALTFINLLQKYKKGGSPSWRQPFDAANWIHQKYPGALGDIDQFLPFNEDVMQWLGAVWAGRNQGVPATLDQIPDELKPLYTVVAKLSAKSDTELFYNLRYVVLTQIHNAINTGAVVPNFSKRMLEILGENYISLATKAKGKPGIGQYITTVKWPSKMGGRITLAHKAESSKWATSMTWILN
jgi:hypothetical protein